MTAWLNRIRRSSWPAAVLVTFVVGLIAQELTRNVSYDLTAVLTARPSHATNLVLVLAKQGSLSTNSLALARQQHARILERIEKERPRLIVYDFFFEVETEGDEPLQKAMKACANLYLPAALDGGGRHRIEVPPTNRFLTNITDYGHAGVFGGRARFFSPAPFAIEPYFVWKAATNYNISLTNLVKENSLWFNYYDPPEAPFASVTFAEILSSPESRVFGFKDQCVFVGAAGTSGSLDDRFETPFSLFGGQKIPGVIIHATAFLNLIRDEYFERPGRAGEFLMVALWAACAGLVLHQCSRLPLWAGSLVALAMGLALAAGSIFMTSTAEVWWPWFGASLFQTGAALAWTRVHPKGNRYDVFISYRRAGSLKEADMVRHFLTEKGYRCFFDKKEVHPGPFPVRIEKALRSARIFLLCISPGTLQRRVGEDRTYEEIDMAEELAAKGQIKIVPLWLNKFSFATDRTVPETEQIERLKVLDSVIFGDEDTFETFIPRVVRLIDGKSLVE